MSAAFPALPPEEQGDLEKVVAVACAMPLEALPGQAVNYSPIMAHAVLAGAVKRLDGDQRAFRDIMVQDLFQPLKMNDSSLGVDKGSETVAVEVESLSGTKDCVNAVANVMKAARLADRVEVVVKNRQRANKLQRYLWESPLRSYRGLTIRLLKEYIH
jgi:hypothetical protein